MNIKRRLGDSLLWALNRLPSQSRFELVPREPVAGWYDEDAVRSSANHEFVQDPAFVRAYERGVRAAGWDYGIRWRIHVALWAATAGTRIPGDFVECGVGRGMTSSAILESLPTWGQLGKRFWLIDTFLPYWTNSAGEQTSEAGVSEFYATGSDAVAANFAEWPNVEIVQGRVPEILGEAEVEAVAYLHIDLNAAEAERDALAHFWPLMSTGALALFDDYGFGGEHRLQKAAVDEFARAAGVPVLSLPTGQGLMIK